MMVLGWTGVIWCVLASQDECWHPNQEGNTQAKQSEGTPVIQSCGLLPYICRMEVTEERELVFLNPLKKYLGFSLLQERAIWSNDTLQPCSATQPGCWSIFRCLNSSLQQKAKPLHRQSAPVNSTAQRGKHTVEKYDGFMSFMAYTANTEKQLGFGEYFFKSEENDWQGRENKYYTLERVRDIIFFFPNFTEEKCQMKITFPGSHRVILPPFLLSGSSSRAGLSLCPKTSFKACSLQWCKFTVY